MAIVHRHVGGPLLAPTASNMFRYGEAGSLSDALRRAGFVDTDEELRTLPWHWPGPPEEVWEYAQGLSTPFHPLLNRIPPDQRDQIDREVLTAIRQYVEGDTVRFAVRVVFASGKVAAS
jgi:hypothetical protein